MASRFASPCTTGDGPDEVTSRAGRRAARRAARRHVCLRVAGLFGALAIGASATAVGVSTHPTAVPPSAGAAEAPARPSELTDLSGAELAVARRSVSAARPVEGVLLTHAATKTEQERVAAAAAAAAAVELRSHTGVDWDGIARCETGGNWSMQGSSFSGGLGFANTTWRSFGGGEFAANAGQASREQQIVVAERVYARYGLSGWGCRRAG
jgi:Transglycosylase-like domain